MRKAQQQDKDQQTVQRPGKSMHLVGIKLRLNVRSFPHTKPVRRPIGGGADLSYMSCVGHSPAWAEEWRDDQVQPGESRTKSHGYGCDAEEDGKDEAHREANDE